MPGGKPKDPDYWKKYRAAHPKYTEREKARLKLRDRSGPRDRTAEYAKRKSRAVVFEPIPNLHQGHELFEQAVKFLGRRVREDKRQLVYDSYYEDALSEVVIGLLEGLTPHAGLSRLKRREHKWTTNNNTGAAYIGNEFEDKPSGSLILDGSVW